MTLSRDHLSRPETVTVAAVEGGVPSLVEARELVGAFQAMIREKALADLQPWIERAQGSLIASLSTGSSRTRLRLAPRSPRLGPTGRLRAKSPNSSW
jgi:hypothetical protein